MAPISATLLIVDDEESNRDLLARRLERRGFRVLLAPDGPSALEQVARQHVDLVLLDIMMPGMDGMEVLRRVRRRFPATELPIIMVTAKTDSQDVVSALEAGANDYITKPIDFAVTLARVEAQLRTRRVEPPATVEMPVAQRMGPGAVIAGKYRIESRIGAGHFGTVYRARHLGLDLGVAVKVLLPSMADTPEALTRFQREGISACRVRHPNAVAVMDFGVEGETAYMVMELLTGQSLEDELARSGRLPVGRAVGIVLPVCRVLAESHRAGIIHRDIKPANVFLHQTPQGEVVKVLDFGIAKLADEPSVTAVGLVLGTPAYMAPERFKGRPCEGSSDVYSVGTMLYQMLAGRLPFVPERPDPIALADLKLTTDPRALREIAPDVPEVVDGIVLRALAREPERRPTAEGLEQELMAALGLVPETGPARVAAIPVAVPTPAPEDDESPTEALPSLTGPEPDPDDDAA